MRLNLALILVKSFFLSAFVELPFIRLDIFSKWHLDVLLRQFAHQLANDEAISQVLLKATDLHPAITTAKFEIYPAFEGTQ